MPLPANSFTSVRARRRWRIPAAMALGVCGLLPAPAALAAEAAAATHDAFVPSPVWAFPFLALLLAIAVFPLVSTLEHWWERNRNKFLVAGVLGALTCVYYGLRGHGLHGSEPGLAALGSLLKHSVLIDYIPFIVLLFSLYTISGGIRLSGDIPAHPLTNTGFLLVGGLLASLIGTTGASMLLIRPLLQVNGERKHVKHTVIFFIFLVSNIGGALLPVGDPPLFMGYLRGVPFLWTLHLTPEWLVCSSILLVVYYAMDHFAYKHEDLSSLKLDEAVRVPLRLEGKRNFVLLLGVVLAVALLVPGKTYLGWTVPDVYLREIVQLVLAGLSMVLTDRAIRRANHFNFHAITEVAALFIGIFITMQVPIEILQVLGPRLGLDTPRHFYWFSGALSSFLDNTPTYVVFFEAAGGLTSHGMPVMTGLKTLTGGIPIPMLEAISLGSVFMGANTYIGNGPNFLVKSIAESRGIKMPSFFGYTLYSLALLMPIFVIISLVFFRD
ncbi:MAG: sodium:proton antiporter [bacterium]|nr:sodium:proton antiporter [bacterium]